MDSRLIPLANRRPAQKKGGGSDWYSEPPRHTISSDLKGGQEQMLPADTDEPHEKRALALEMLDALRRDQDKIRHHKLFYMRIARENGALFDEIGAAFGVTGDAVRMALRRAGDSEAT